MRMRAWRFMIIRRRAVRKRIYARVAELVDALASGASVSNDVEVQVLSRAPSNTSSLMGKKISHSWDLFLSKLY